MLHSVRVVGHVRSTLATRAQAPRQGNEGAPRAAIVIEAEHRDGLRGIVAGDEIVLLTWLHQARRDVLLVHPRNEPERPLSGVFATRSPDRPNPIGLHRVRVISVNQDGLDVEPLEAIDGTPLLDIKPVLAVGDD